MLDWIIWALVTIVAANVIFFGFLYMKYILDIWKERKGKHD